LAFAIIAFAGAISGLLFALGVTPGAVMIPVSLAAIGILLWLPFPVADYGLAIALIGTIPVLPPIGLPNLPLAAVVIVIAVVRVAIHQRRPMPWRALAVLMLPWLILGSGLALSHWPPLSVWLRPAAILAFGLLASILGLLVWSDEERRLRWLVGISIGLIVVGATAMVVFALQYVLSVDRIVDAVIALQGFLRGDAAAAKFDARNNWVISGATDTLRAVSPLFPAPNNVGGYIGVAAPLSAALWIVGKTRRSRAIGGLAVATAVATLFVTHSRSSWAAAFLAGMFVLLAGVFLFRRLRDDPGWTGVRGLRRHALIVGVAAAIGAGGVLTTLNAQVLTRLSDPGDDVSVTSRIEADAQAAGHIQSNPLSGAGLGNWTGASDDVAAREDPYRFTYVHNVYLQYGVAAGLLGILWGILAVALLIVGGIFSAARSGGRRAAFPGLALVAVGVFAGIQFLFDDNLLNPQYAWLLFWSVGAAAAGVASSRARTVHDGRARELIGQAA
jgi:hypothetical protein